MTWSISEVARMSRVTSRTLRHYDEIGLLKPAGQSSGGYRVYDESNLLRLQQILVLRQLDLGLADIAAILDQHHDQLDALRSHYVRLTAERDRLQQVAQTVARTIDELEKQKGTPEMGKINRPENLFEGFDASSYEAEASERWPEEAEQSKRFTDTLTPADTEQMQREMTAAMIRMAELMHSGQSVGAEAVQAEVDWSYRSVSRMWTPDAAVFTALGQMYVDDPRFKATYDAIAIGLAEFYRDAMAVYAVERLA